jgi:signal transduction histidine kinase
MKLRLLHLEDNRNDVELVRATLARAGLDCEVLAVDTGPAYKAALQGFHFDAVLSDSRVLGYDGNEALSDARARFPGIPFIVVSAAGSSCDSQTAASPVTARVPKSGLQRLASTIREALPKPTAPTPNVRVATNDCLQRLVSTVQRLSLARDLSSIIDIVRREARAMVQADGATFVLREGSRCFYAEEDAIAPLWKGQRFPVDACISGWTMLNQQAAIIEDVDLDARIPRDTYRPTFVKSLVVTPIRSVAPIGAIGVYWATPHAATQEEIGFLRALADSTSVAIEAAEVFANLERKIAERTAEVDRRNTELEVLNKELEAFSYSFAHDLRSPLITIDGFTQVLHENIAHRLDETNREHLTRISAATRRMHQLLNDLLALSKIVRAPMHAHSVDLSRLAREILQMLRQRAPTRAAEFVVAEGLTTQGDPALLRIALENLLSNAWKFTAREELTRIEFESGTDRAARPVYYIRDNGVGFDPRYAAKLFGPFQRLHAQTQFPGTGIGLATVQRIIHRHGGEIWAESAVDCGATFYFRLPR